MAVAKGLSNNMGGDSLVKLGYDGVRNPRLTHQMGANRRVIHKYASNSRLQERLYAAAIKQ